MKLMIGGVGLGLGRLFLLGLSAVAALALLNLKDLQRYLRLREM
jgi:hypothetical protein